MKVRLKNEIVTMGVPQINPAQQTGTYVDANEWNGLIADPDVMVVDTRNTYEDCYWHVRGRGRSKDHKFFVIFRPGSGAGKAG